MKDRSASRQILGVVTSATVLLLSWMSPGFAQDPFRSSNQRAIGGKTESAFEALFKDGNYTAAKQYLQEAESSEPDEPLAYAMKASLAFTDGDVNSLASYGQKTLTTAQKLMYKDPLRGNLYTAVGHFLQGAAALRRDGSIKGTPQALLELRQVYDSLDKAQAVSPNDPELNLIRGYMDLMLAVNIPFSDPEQAIDRLGKFAGPRYLAERGLAIGYRDLNKYSEALKAVEDAMQAAPNNPELFYLKGQILVKQGQSQKKPALYQEALSNFDKAIAKEQQLPRSLSKQIARERRRTVERLSKPQQ